MHHVHTITGMDAAENLRTPRCSWWTGRGGPRPTRRRSPALLQPASTGSAARTWPRSTPPDADGT
ncbi:hypothetical protein QJS66_10090 [Kocuria rhizophila]|nr:hypothetical protein QJS66_10090 [Kocuria rhizophila]